MTVLPNYLLFISQTALLRRAISLLFEDAKCVLGVLGRKNVISLF